MKKNKKKHNFEKQIKKIEKQNMWGKLKLNFLPAQY